MELHQIRYFLAVCETRNFTKAAQQSFVSQPSLTQAIQRLEDELGGTLFLRGRNGAELTALGQHVEPNLRSTYETSLQAKENAVRFQRLKKQPVRVGVMHSVGRRKINPFFAKFQKENPKVELELIIEDQKTLNDKWNHGDVDTVIAPNPGDAGKGITFETLYQEDYVVVLPMAHPLAKKSKLTLSDLRSEPYLDRLNCEMREILKQELEGQGIELYAAYRTNREEWLIDMVREGIGFAIIPEYSVVPGNGITVTALNSPHLSREIGMLTRPPSHGQRGKELVCQLRRFFS